MDTIKMFDIGEEDLEYGSSILDLNNIQKNHFNSGGPQLNEI